MYYLIYGLLYLLSRLPIRLLYLLADGLSFFLYRIIRYRRDVVMNNLLIAFPDKTLRERRDIAAKFYRNFVDNFIETIKLLSADRDFITSRFVIDNPELLESVCKSGRKCQLHLGHMFNWEIADIAMPFYTKFDFLVVYMPIENKSVDRLFRKLRSRTGTILLPATDMRKAILPYRNQQYLLTLVADQAPGAIGQAYWLDFFGKPTPFVRGPERGARIADIPVIFVNIYKTRRGYYRARLEMGSDNPAALPEGQLTRLYARNLEEAIRRNPSMWLWSHRRWKNQWKNQYSRNWIGSENGFPQS